VRHETELLRSVFDKQRAIADACARELSNATGLTRTMLAGWLSEIQLQLLQLERQIAQLQDSATPSAELLDKAWHTLFDVAAGLNATRVDAQREEGQAGVSLGAVRTRLRLVFATLAAQLALSGAVLAVSLASLTGWYLSIAGDSGKVPFLGTVWQRVTAGTPSFEIRLVVLGSLLGMLAITTHLNWKFRHRWDTLGFLPWYAVKLLGAPIFTLTVFGLLANSSVSFGGAAISLTSASRIAVFAIATLTGLFSNVVFNFLRDKAGVAFAGGPSSGKTSKVPQQNTTEVNSTT